ncbi:MAG: MBL fold metallo-hydrolase [Proteobacteria bacterium]|nr:MBL fold metallo-hydrolase [Pseudomonadota bacterium]
MKLAVLVAALLIAAPLPALARPLFAPWIDGTGASEPQMQVQRCDADTFVIRQSVKTNFEAPFLYLLFGKDRALLLDTGAGGLKVRPTIDGVIAGWLKAHHRTSIPLVVAHSHSHGDHRMGDAEFKDRPDTTVVGWTAPEVAAFFHIDAWPSQIVPFDLGGRRLDIVPTPGHHPSHIMVFDEKTRLLLSGDSLYPGRLYVPVSDFADYKASIERVVGLTRDRQVSHVLGAHIEMTTTPGQDYKQAAPTHPAEHALELPYADLLELQAALRRMGETPTRDVHPDFIVTPLTPRPAAPRVPKPAG